MTNEEPGQPHDFGLDRDDHSAQRCRLTIRGDVDIDAAPRLTAAVDAALRSGRRHIELDLVPVTFLDSTGLSALLRSRDAATAAGGTLYVISASSTVVRLLEITDLTDLLDDGAEDRGEDGAAPTG